MGQRGTCRDGPAARTATGGRLTGGLTALDLTRAELDAAVPAALRALLALQCTTTVPETMDSRAVRVRPAKGSRVESPHARGLQPPDTRRTCQLSRVSA